MAARNGLSELGRQVIAEMNRWGIMVDVSHPSKASNMQAIALSKAPVIASHSAARALANHSRNMDDEQLMALKKNGGVMQTVAFASYVKVEDPAIAQARQQAVAALRQEFGVAAAPAAGGGGGGGGRGAGGGRGDAAAAGRGDAAAGRGAGRGDGGPAPLFGRRSRQSECRRAAGAAAEVVADAAVVAWTPRRWRPCHRSGVPSTTSAWRTMQAKYPPMPRANVEDFVNHIDYLVKKIGIDHVGISSDFDGGGGVDGWNSASETFNVTLELVRRGYTEAADRQDLERQSAPGLG